MMKDAVIEFIDREVWPLKERFENKDYALTEEIMRKAGEMGFLGVSIPEEYGGAGLDQMSYGLIMQEIERGDSGVRSTASVQSSLVMYPIWKYGNEEQRKKYLPKLQTKQLKKLNDLFCKGKRDTLVANICYINGINKKHNLNIKHVNIPSGQVPSKETLTKFFEVLDDKDNYPVLIHCYHGTGRAQMYSALYRLEYENWKNEDARQKTRFIVEGFGYRSSFSSGKGKGDFLINYKPRNEGDISTLNTLKK